MVDALLEASTRILAEGGASAMTTNAVAERAGVSVGSLYQYFPNRDAILVSLIERFEIGMQARMESALEQSRGDFRTSLGILVRAALAHHFERVAVVAILEAEEHRIGPAAELILAHAEGQMTGFIRAFVGAHAAAESAEVDRVAHRMEIVGRALVDDAVRRRDLDPRVPDEIVAILIACASERFWASVV